MKKEKPFSAILMKSKSVAFSLLFSIYKLLFNLKVLLKTFYVQRVVTGPML